MSKKIEETIVIRNEKMSYAVRLSSVLLPSASCCVPSLSVLISLSYKAFNSL